MYIVTLVLNYVSTSGLINDTDQAQLADKYYLPISPPGWTFSIWGIIYIWQAAWLVYITYHSIRYRQELQTKEILTFGKSFYISWIVSCICNGSWIILFAFEELTVSAIILICISIALYINGYTSHKYIGRAAIYRMENEMGQSVDNSTEFPSYLLSRCSINSYRGLILNGIAFYATWTSIAQCLNIAIFLTYVANMNAYTASIIALTILTIVILSFWFLDFYYLRSWLIYTYSPYAVLIWALYAVSTNSNEGDLGLKGPTKSFEMALLIMSIVGTVLKIISGVIYACKPKEQQVSSQHIKQYSEDVGVGAEYNMMEEL